MARRGVIRQAAPLASLTLLAACSQAPSHLQQATKMPRMVTEFEDWCDQWALHCPAAPANVPSAEKPWSKDQWRDLFAGLKAVSGSPSNLAMTRSDIDDPRLSKVFDLVGAGNLLRQMRDRLGTAGFQEVRLAGGEVTITAAQASQNRGPSGLVVKNAPRVDLRINQDLSVDVTGVQLASDNGSQETLHGYGVTDTNLLSWQGDANHEFEDVPIRFLLDEVLGVQLGDAKAPGKKGYKDLLPALLPLKDWLVAGQRELDLDQATFAALSEHLPRLMEKEHDAETIGYVLGRMKALRSTATSRERALVSGEASRSLHCSVGDDAEITVSTSFALEDLRPLDGGGVRVTLSGVQARPLRGLVRPTISLRTLDLTPHAITVHDVPVIGTYTVDMDDTRHKSLTCED